MKKYLIGWLFLILLAFFIAKTKQVEASETKLKLKPSYQAYLPIQIGSQKAIICCSQVEKWNLPLKKPDEVSEDKQESLTEKPSQTQPNCELVYIVDIEQQDEVGHYQMVHHPAVTKVERVYIEYIEYCFYHQDGSTYLYCDYDKNFSADQFLAQHPEYIRYTYCLKYDEQKKTIIVKEAYDEEIWVIDIPYQREIGHYEQRCH